MHMYRYLFCERNFVFNLKSTEVHLQVGNATAEK